MTKNKKTILALAGTRPEGIKFAPVVRELRRRAKFRVVLCSTGQHRKMLRQVLQSFDLAPDRDLDLMVPGQTPAQIASRTFAELPRVLAEEQPACILVQGDTTTAFAGAVAAFYSGVPVAHVEAGLRTGDLAAPFPEEANRRLVSVVAQWHFAPTERARTALLEEGIVPAHVWITGNTVIDALQHIAASAPPLPNTLHPAPGRKLILVTGHRRESFGEGLDNLCTALSRLAAAYPHEISILYPVHPNPQVHGPVCARLGKIANVHLVDPLDYTTFVAAMRDSYFIITDSGGVQEEAPALGKPVLVTREVTERPEAIEAGCAQLVGTDPTRLLSAAEMLLTDPSAYAAMSRAQNPFGDGHASERIADILEQTLS